MQSLGKKSQKLVVDYIVHYASANKTKSREVFKLKTFEIEKNAVLSITKKHPMRKITTRKFYPGIHSLEIQVNGKIMGKKDWKLTI